MTRQNCGEDNLIGKTGEMKVVFLFYKNIHLDRIFQVEHIYVVSAHIICMVSDGHVLDIHVTM